MNAPRGAAVFLDRDGVLNEAVVRDGRPYPPDSLQTLRLCDGVAEGLSALHGAGYRLIVVTNQPDVARGTQRRSVVEEINQSLARRLGLTAVYACYHDNGDECACRKPRAGMLTRAAEEHGIDLRRSYMVGDRWGDVAAGAAAGCETLLNDMPYSQCHRCTPDHKVADLAEAADVILRRLDAAADGRAARANAFADRI